MRTYPVVYVNEQGKKLRYDPWTPMINEDGMRGKEVVQSMVRQAAWATGYAQSTIRVASWMCDK